MADTSNYGAELLAWEIKEYHEHARGLMWIIGAVVAGIALLIYAVSARNFLFAFIVLMFGIILATHSLRPPLSYKFTIHERGISLGQRFYLWKEFDNFWVVEDPPAVKTLYFEFTGFRPRLPIPLEQLEARAVRGVLQGKIREDAAKTEEPLSDWLARVLKI